MGCLVAGNLACVGACVSSSSGPVAQPLRGLSAVGNIGAISVPSVGMRLVRRIVLRVWAPARVEVGEPFAVKPFAVEPFTVMLLTGLGKSQ